MVFESLDKKGIVDMTKEENQRLAKIFFSGLIYGILLDERFNNEVIKSYGNYVLSLLKVEDFPTIEIK